MNKLWKATAMMARDRSLLDAAASLAAVRQIRVDDGNPSLAEQPTAQALAAIDQLFRERGLHLAIYELAELNRWMVAEKQGKPEGTDGFPPAVPPHEVSKQLGLFWSNVSQLAQTVPESAYNEFLEAVGMLLVDGWFRHKFGTDPTVRIREHGLNLSREEEDKLRAVVAPGSVADAAAGKFFALAWSGSSCSSFFMMPPGWIHTNT